jgi:tripartite-type tricarboxylate transporter receptor subunit TctC
MVHIPYRSVAAGMTDMLSGQVQVTFGTSASTIEYVRAGTLRALAVTTATRSELLPELPTIADFVPGYEASAWFGVAAPKNTPLEIIERINAEINACLADPKFNARLTDIGGVALAGSPDDFARLIGEERSRSGLRWLSFLAPRPSYSVAADSTVHTDCRIAARDQT